MVEVSICVRGRASSAARSKLRLRAPSVTVSRIGAEVAVASALAGTARGAVAAR